MESNWKIENKNNFSTKLLDSLSRYISSHMIFHHLQYNTLSCEAYGKAKWYKSLMLFLSTYIDLHEVRFRWKFICLRVCHACYYSAVSNSTRIDINHTENFTCIYRYSLFLLLSVKYVYCIALHLRFIRKHYMLCEKQM